MLRKKVIIDFDSERIAVMVDGVLLKLCPSSVVRKTTEMPVAVSYGDEAEKNKDSLGSSEVYCTPFKDGRIVDETAARILFRSVLRELLGKNPLANIYVLVSGGLSKEDKFVISRSFSSCGYGRVTIVPRPKIIARLLGFNNLYCGLYMDTDVSELALGAEGNLLCSHTIDVSLSALAEQIRERFLSDGKLKLSVETSLNVAKKYCSLFEFDNSKIIAVGTDAITAGKKSVYFAAKDVYALCDGVYSKTTDLISAALLDADKDFAIATAKSGILFLGSGTRIGGFEEYVYKKLGIGGFIMKDDSVLLSVTHNLAVNEPDFLEE